MMEALAEFMEGQVIKFVFTNHAGRTELRTVEPVRLAFGVSPWYLEQKIEKLPEWHLVAFCLDKMAERHFALAQIDTNTIEVGRP